MRCDAKKPTRVFIGNDGPIEMKDCGTLLLAADEQVTLLTESGAEFDIARLRAVLIQNRGTKRYFCAARRARTRGNLRALSQCRESADRLLARQQQGMRRARCQGLARLITGPRPTLDYPCGERHLGSAFACTLPSADDVAFLLAGKYFQDYWRCTPSNHWFSHHDTAPGWDCTALDPDARSAVHVAAAEGETHEEFFIEHHHVFSPAPVALLAARPGFDLLALERLREPTGKPTLRASLEPLASP